MCCYYLCCFQAEDGIRDLVRSRGLGDVYKRQDRALAVLQQASIYNSDHKGLASEYGRLALENDQAQLAEKLLSRADDPLKPDWKVISAQGLSLIHI